MERQDRWNNARSAKAGGIEGNKLQDADVLMGAFRGFVDGEARKKKKRGASRSRGRTRVKRQFRGRARAAKWRPQREALGRVSALLGRWVMHYRC